VLAALGKFTLWGAVLVDVGTSLLVILHGMLLMRWRLPGAERATKCSSNNQAGACSSKPCGSGNTAAEHDEHRTANSITGKSPCCSSSKQCSTKDPVLGCSKEASCTKQAASNPYRQSTVTFSGCLSYHTQAHLSEASLDHSSCTYWPWCAFRVSDA